MKLKDLVAVSAMPGLHKMIGARKNGLIVENLETGKRAFAPSRTHQFSPLDSIAIYTDDDATPLREVFDVMHEKAATLPPAEVKTDDADALRAYFAEILPNYDRDRVHLSDMRKVVRWYEVLRAKDMLIPDDEPDVEVEVEDDSEA